jgi:adenylate cyclase
VISATQLKNIAEPVHIYSLEVGQPAEARPAPSALAAVKPETPAPRQSAWSARWHSLAAALVALILLAAGSWYVLGGRVTKPTQAAHFSIVVLPFANLSSDPAQDYFADAITENLTTELSRIKDSFVIARNTAFTFKGRSVDAKEIGKELGVRYVLEGSVQRDQNRVRVNAQLIDTDSGAHLWAQRFEEDVADLFKLQDQVVARLANTLGYELVKAEAAKGARSTNPDANDLVMRGWVLNNEQSLRPSENKNNVARALFEQALAIDPNNAAAIDGMAETYVNEHNLGWGSSGTDYDAKILGQIDRVIALAPGFDEPYDIKSAYLAMSHRFDEAVRVANAGVAVNPNNPYIYHHRALAEISLGRLDEAKFDMQQAIRLSPDDPWRVDWDRQLANIEFAAGHLEAAVDAYRKVLDAGDRTFWPYASLAAAYALQGKMDDAKRYVAETLHLNPNFTIKWLREHALDIPIRNEGLRKAGFAEE